MPRATVRTLQNIKDVTEETAKRVIWVWTAAKRAELISQFPNCATYVDRCHTEPGTRSLRRLAINSLIEACGVELLGISKRTNEQVYYCNAGDTYATTVLFEGRNMRVGCIGDIANNVRNPQNAFD